jgi:D-beta-D-heptose 7-phosphate kinase/D-beta-D-heptose 1-phosphate adenosyltransferase
MNAEKIASFRGRKILVVGDVMIDKYVWGDVARISPEAPVPVLSLVREERILGGAANVAANVSALEGTALVCGVIGQDADGSFLLEECERRGIRTSGTVSVPDRPTIQKTRFMGGRQQLLRVDREEVKRLPSAAHDQLLAAIRSLRDEPDSIVVSDYAKGVLSAPVMDLLREISRRRGIPLITDGKPGNLHCFHDVTLIKPNLRDAAEMSGMAMRNEQDLAEMGNALRDRFDCSVLITLGEHGMALFEVGREMVRLAIRARRVYDVTGAGDTVAAVLGLAMATGCSTEESARIANAAAGIVVGKVGTATVTPEELSVAIPDAEAFHT